MICNECRKELHESMFPNDIQTWCKDTKTYKKQSICKKCKYTRSKYRWNKEQRTQYKKPRPSGHEKYTFKRILEDQQIVGWNGFDEAYY